MMKYVVRNFVYHPNCKQAIFTRRKSKRVAYNQEQYTKLQMSQFSMLTPSFRFDLCYYNAEFQSISVFFFEIVQTHFVQ